MTLTGNPLSVTAGVCFPFAERQDGWHGGPGASLILPLPLPDAQEVIVSAAFMPGWHRADQGPAPNVPGLPGYSLHSSLPCSIPSLRSSLCLFFFILHLALWPRLRRLEGGSPFSAATRLEGLFLSD